MRRKDREVISKEGLLSIVSHCKVCRIALMDGDLPLIYPLNFGYEWEGKFPVFYFHSAKEGKKAALLKEGATVSFEMDCGHELMPGPSPCEYGFRFRSVMGKGRIHFPKTGEEKCRALSLLMRHQTGKEFAFTDEMACSVLIFSLSVEKMTGKERN
jgi:nitroimidazol reductase NimA-like FMN-containing flavoprotein (pyridoxamine 5'-phosphate oxidase superfamily)